MNTRELYHTDQPLHKSDLSAERLLLVAPYSAIVGNITACQALMPSQILGTMVKQETHVLKQMVCISNTYHP